jgi:hypothetical protein
VDVLVDARNVARSRWPNIPDTELVERVRAWAAANQVRAVVVFDGSAPGVGAGERVLEDGTVLIGTGSTSADARLIDEADERREAGTRFRLVTSDRALRAVAGRAAEAVVGGGTFAGVLLGEPSGRFRRRRA